MDISDPDNERPRELTSAEFHILLALSDRERHGYGIMQEVAGLTEGRMRLGAGTLYRSIKKMLVDGLIEESGKRPDSDLDDERRRYYRMTKQGRRVARLELARIQSLVQAAQSKKLVPLARLLRPEVR
jgi:DNA-binding PadR family transcriptional regulator